jgi:feruloyl-CoA synthase
LRARSATLGFSSKGFLKLADTILVAPKYKIDLKRAAVDVKRLADGNLILRSPYDLPPSKENIGDWLRKWAAADPKRLFLAKRAQTQAQWDEITYGDALKQVRSIAQALASRELSPVRPVLLISKNGIDNALLQLAAMDIGVPAIHVNPTLALKPEQFEGFKHIIQQTTPGLVFAAEGAPFATALKYAADQGAEILLSSDPVAGLPSTEFGKITKSWRKGAAVKARAKNTPETIAKVHYSGTQPSEMVGIVTTQVTMSINQDALAVVIPQLGARPPIIVDDAPWHHASGGNLIFNAALRNGGTLYIDRFGPENQNENQNVNQKGDEGAALETPSPSIHFTEAMPFYGLVSRLEENILLRKAFFRNLDLIWIVNGTISHEIKGRLQALAREQTGFEIPILASFSGVGTAAINTALYFESDSDANIGLPVPGTFIKLVRIGAEQDDNWGIMVNTPGLNPAIWQNGGPIKAETDEDGYFTVYETVRLIDPMRPFKGIERQSRVTEA